MIHLFNDHLKLPSIFELSETSFWNDEHVSKELLKAHLDPDFEGASRNETFINESVLWISRIVSPTLFPQLLDLGCGPGIYAERFAKAGFNVTGIDFSERSIIYARESAKKRNLNITYKCQNYLELVPNAKFDFATMIYCDYGALSSDNRSLLMEKVYSSLKPGGFFLLDVFSIKKFEVFEEKQTWEYCPDGGFWSSSEYISLDRNYKYPDDVSLEQTIVISKDVSRSHLIWNQYFTKQSLIAETTKVGFCVQNIFNNVAGEEFEEYGMTMAILLKKP